MAGREGSTVRGAVWLRRVPVGVVPNALGLMMCLASLLTFSCPANAEWRLGAESLLFYTDDAALFSATRRLTRDQDPTQPVIDRDLAEQGDDVVYEPAAQLSNAFNLFGQDTEVAMRAQGFIFAENSQFNQASLGLQARHELTPKNELLFRYYFNPDLFLGENEVRTAEESGGGEARFADEEVTTNFWAAGIGHEIVEDVALKLFGRYGIRRYNEPFAQRDTDFWTIGIHGEWTLHENVELVLGYHYERGLAEGRKQPLLKDDVSYYNNFVTGELLVELTHALSLEMAVHYERNDWTTGTVGDRRNGQHEDILQGDLAFLYQYSDRVELEAGFQGAHRKESFEEALRNFNGWVGGRVVF